MGIKKSGFWHRADNRRCDLNSYAKQSNPLNSNQDERSETKLQISNSSQQNPNTSSSMAFVVPGSAQNPSTEEYSFEGAKINDELSKKHQVDYYQWQGTSSKASNKNNNYAYKDKDSGKIKIYDQLNKTWKDLAPEQTKELEKELGKETDRAKYGNAGAAIKEKNPELFEKVKKQADAFKIAKQATESTLANLTDSNTAKQITDELGQSFDWSSALMDKYMSNPDEAIASAAINGNKDLAGYLADSQKEARINPTQLKYYRESLNKYLANLPRDKTDNLALQLQGSIADKNSINQFELDALKLYDQINRQRR